MKLNFFYLNLHTLLFGIFAYLLKFIITTGVNDIFILDVLSRLNSNDFWITKLYFFWTNFFYLYTFIFIMLAGFVVVFNFFKNLNLLLLLVFFIIAFLNLLCDYWANIFYGYFNNYELVNSLLTNNLNRYHPFIFYLTGLFVISSVLNFKDNNMIFLTQSLFIKNFLNGAIFLTLTLYIGSWWAFQEGSWGGWWNWDPSEVFGLLTLFIYLLSLHKQHWLSRIYVFNVFLLKTIYIVLFIFIVIQLNFDSVNHNFGTRTNSFVNLSTVFLIELALLSVYLLILYKQLFVSPKITSYILNFSVKTICFISIWIFIVTSIFIDLWLSNSFKYSNYNLIKTLLNFKIYMILLYFLILFCIYELSMQSIIVFSCLFFSFFYINNNLGNCSVLFLIIFINLQVNWLTLSHLMILITMYLNFDTYFRVISVFSGLTKWSIVYLLPKNSNIFVCNNTIDNLIFFDRSLLSIVNVKNEIWWFSKIISLTEVIQTFKRGLFSSYHSLILTEASYLPLLSIIFFILVQFMFQKYLHLKITY